MAKFCFFWDADCKRRREVVLEQEAREKAITGGKAPEKKKLGVIGIIGIVVTVIVVIMIVIFVIRRMRK